VWLCQRALLKLSPRSLRPLNSGCEQRASLTTQGGHPAGGVARASVSQPLVALQRPAGLHASRRGRRRHCAPRSLCRTLSGKTRRGARATVKMPKKKSERRGFEARPRSVLSPSRGGGREKSRKKGISGQTLGSEKPRFSEMTPGQSTGRAGRIVRQRGPGAPWVRGRRLPPGQPARAHVELRGAERRRPSALGRPGSGVRAPAPRRGRSRPGAAAGPACAPLRGRGGPGVGAEGL
jgi:hypothetical protein